MLPTLQALEASINSPDLTGADLKNQQDLLCGLIQVQLVKIGDKIGNDMANKIIDLIISLF